MLGPIMAKRALRVDLKVMRTLLSTRLLPMATLQQLSVDGSLSGLDGCGALLGGCVVGLRDSSFWTPCIITGLGLELYGSAEELGEPKPMLAPKVQPSTLLAGAGFVALDKPAGLRTEDALRFLKERHPHSELVSRLDKGTSGCLVIGTSFAGAANLTRQFAEGAVAKTYLAIVWGEKQEETGQVHAPLALLDLGGGSRYRAYVAADGKPALTSFQVLARADGAMLLAVFPKTGRTHQIRCHLAHIGLPLIGDTKYGGRKVAWCHRLPLHCLRVIAKDASGGPLDVYSPVPTDFATMVAFAIGQTVPGAEWWHSVAACSVEVAGGLSRLSPGPQQARLGWLWRIEACCSATFSHFALLLRRRKRSLSRHRLA